jgi:antitoxin HicB
MRYPVIIHKEKEGGCWLSFPDVEGTYTNGTSEADAMSHALDALETMFDYFFEEQLPVPLPSAPKRGQRLLEIPASLTAKILLHNELLHQKVRPVELARRLGIPRQEMTRILNSRHKTKIDSIGAALGALGKRLELTIA